MSEINAWARDPAQEPDILVEVTLPQGQHVVSLYFLDNDFRRRQYEVSVRDQGGDELCKSTVTDMYAGVYQRFALIGHGKFAFHIRKLSGDRKKLCGVFWDPLRPMAAYPRPVAPAASLRDLGSLYQQLRDLFERDVGAYSRDRQPLADLASQMQSWVRDNAKSPARPEALWMLWQCRKQLAHHEDGERAFEEWVDSVLVDGPRASPTLTEIERALSEGQDKRLEAILLEKRIAAQPEAPDELFKALWSVQRDLVEDAKALKTCEGPLTSRPKSALVPEAVDTIRRIWTDHRMTGHVEAHLGSLRADLPGIAVREPRRPSLAGRIVRKADGEPVANATVTARRRTRRGKNVSFDETSAASGPDGTYEISGLPAGDYRLSVRASGLLSDYRHKVLVGETTRREDFALEPGASMGGRVLGPDGRPVPNGQNMTLRVEGTARSLRTYTQVRNGQFACDNLPVGRVRVRAEVSGVGKIDLYNLELKPGPNRCDLHLNAPSRAGVCGRVTCKATGKPIKGATIGILPARRERSRLRRFRMFAASGLQTKVQAKSDGTYRLQGIEPGALTLVAYSDTHLPASQPGVTVEPDQLASGIDFELVKGGTIEGTIFSEDGRSPLRNDRFGIKRRLESSSFGHSLHTDGSGRYSICGLVEGSWSLYVRKGALYALREEVGVSLGTTSEGVDLVMRPGASLTGRVVWTPDDKPIAGVRVYLSGKMSLGAEADDTGAFTFEGLAPGDYRLAVWLKWRPHKTIDVRVGSGQEPEPLTVRIPRSVEPQ